jgi:hypothetical protein
MYYQLKFSNAPAVHLHFIIEKNQNLIEKKKQKMLVTANLLMYTIYRLCFFCMLCFVIKLDICHFIKHDTHDLFN